MCMRVYACYEACEHVERKQKRVRAGFVTRVQPDERNGLCVRARVYTGWLGTLEYVLRYLGVV